MHFIRFSVPQQCPHLSVRLLLLLSFIFECCITSAVKRYMVSISWRKHEYQKIPPQAQAMSMRKDLRLEQPRSVDVSQVDNTLKLC